MPPPPLILVAGIAGGSIFAELANRGSTIKRESCMKQVNPAVTDRGAARVIGQVPGRISNERAHNFGNGKSMDDPAKIIVIPKENAVFRLDANGRWHNEFGRFEKKRISDYFHAAIGHDENGYFVSQDKGHVLEKVYFPFEDTALFVFEVVFSDPVALVLNTGQRLPLDPGRLWIENDFLYLADKGHRIRFTDRAMMKISERMEERDGVLAIRVAGLSYPIREAGVAASS